METSANLIVHAFPSKFDLSFVSFHLFFSMVIRDSFEVSFKFSTRLLCDILAENSMKQFLEYTPSITDCTTWLSERRMPRLSKLPGPSPSKGD